MHMAITVAITLPMTHAVIEHETECDGFAFGEDIRPLDRLELCMALARRDLFNDLGGAPEVHLMTRDLSSKLPCRDREDIYGDRYHAAWPTDAESL